MAAASVSKAQLPQSRSRIRSLSLQSTGSKSSDTVETPKAWKPAAQMLPTVQSSPDLVHKTKLFRRRVTSQGELKGSSKCLADEAGASKLSPLVKVLEDYHQPLIYPDDDFLWLPMESVRNMLALRAWMRVKLAEENGLRRSMGKRIIRTALGKALKQLRELYDNKAEQEPEREREQAQSCHLIDVCPLPEPKEKPAKRLPQILGGIVRKTVHAAAFFPGRLQLSASVANLTFTENEDDHLSDVFNSMDDLSRGRNWAKRHISARSMSDGEVAEVKVLNRKHAIRRRKQSQPPPNHRSMYKSTSSPCIASRSWSQSSSETVCESVSASWPASSCGTRQRRGSFSSAVPQPRVHIRPRCSTNTYRRCLSPPIGRGSLLAGAERRHSSLVDCH